MRWRKLGRIFCPDGLRPWMRSHASNPVAEPIQDELFRIYFSTRDEQNRSSVGWVEIDLRRPLDVLRVAEEPVLGPGRIGTFDDSGVSIACIVPRDGLRHLYYVGWNLGVTVPWRNSIGLALGGEDGTFARFSEAPVVDRGPHDPFSLSYPWVLLEDGRWRMWYGSNLDWGPSAADMAHVIKYAESADGITWRRQGHVAIPLAAEGEYALARPCVRREDGRYRMWYSHRGPAYRIGYAESPDGLTWTRRDAHAGIGPSPSGWDSETVCYPCVFDHGGDRFLLYNGNAYGRTGFGLARLEADGA